MYFFISRKFSLYLYSGLKKDLKFEDKKEVLAVIPKKPQKEYKEFIFVDKADRIPGLGRIFYRFT